MIPIWFTPQGRHQSCKYDYIIFLQMSCMLWISLSNTYIFDPNKGGSSHKAVKGLHTMVQLAFTLYLLCKEIQVDYRECTYDLWNKEVTEGSSSFPLVNGHNLCPQSLFKEVNMFPGDFQRSPQISVSKFTQLNRNLNRNYLGHFDLHHLLYSPRNHGWSLLSLLPPPLCNFGYSVSYLICHLMLSLCPDFQGLFYISLYNFRTMTLFSFSTPTWFNVST